jgi:hypothetical protein
VRAFDTRALHGLLFKMDHQRQGADLSERQEWLWDAGVSELEWRWLHPGPGEQRCACRLCVPPFYLADD